MMKKIIYLLLAVILLGCFPEQEQKEKQKITKRETYQNRPKKINKNEQIPKEYQAIIESDIDSSFYDIRDSCSGNIRSYLHTEINKYKIELYFDEFIPYEQHVDTFMFITNYDGELICYKTNFLHEEENLKKFEKTIIRKIITSKESTYKNIN